MKKEHWRKGTVFLALTVFLVSLTAFGLAAGFSSQTNSTIIPEYSETEMITAALSISKGTATCSGSLVPSAEQSCSLKMKLYMKSGSSWLLVKSWSTSSSGGKSARLSKTCTVDHGSYKESVKVKLLVRVRPLLAARSPGNFLHYTLFLRLCGCKS